MKYLGVAQSGDGDCVAIVAADKVLDLVLSHPFSSGVSKTVLKY